MDFICEYVKKNKCVDFENREIQDISEAVDILMKRFLERMQGEYPDIKIKELRFCGSMAEKTRLSNNKNKKEKLEFDYLAVLETWTGCGKQRFKESEQHPGYMVIEHEVKDTCSTESENILLTNGIGEIFISQYIDCVQAVCKRNFCQRMASSNDRFEVFFGCSFCTVCMESGYLRFSCISSSVFGFAWMSNRIYDQTTLLIPRNHENADLIDIDFHPLFVEKTNYENVGDGVVHTIALFPKGPSVYSDDVGRLFLWRKSTQEQETRLIQETPTAHKLAFMTLKHMFPKKDSMDMGNTDKCQVFQKFPMVSQYMLKNIFLMHIRKCSKKQTAGKCLANMIGLLSKYCIKQKLPHFLLNYELFEKNVYRLKSFGYCLKAISSLSSIPNVHCELQDIAQDLFTITFIALASEAEASSSNYNQNMCRKDYDITRGNKEVSQITKTVMKKFIQFRYEHSALEAQNYMLEKYSFVRLPGPNWFCIGFQDLCRESAPECHPSICYP